MWSGGDKGNKIPPYSSALPAGSGSALASPPPEVKVETEADGGPKQKPWAPDAGTCFSMGAGAQSEVRLEGNKEWHPYFAALMREEFALAVPARIHPGEDPRYICVNSSGDSDADRITVDDLEDRCADVAVRDLRISRDSAEEQCDALIQKLEKTAEPTTLDVVLDYGKYGLFTGLGLVGTWGVFGPGMTYWHDYVQKRKGKGPDDKDPPAPAGGLPGTAPAASSAGSTMAMSALAAGALTAIGVYGSEIAAGAASVGTKIAAGASAAAGFVGSLCSVVVVPMDIIPGTEAYARTHGGTA